MEGFSQKLQKQTLIKVKNGDLEKSHTLKWKRNQSTFVTYRLQLSSADT